MTALHRGIDGALIGVDRTPLSQAALDRVAEVRRVTGWRPYRVGPWALYGHCGACGHDGRWEYYAVAGRTHPKSTVECPLCQTPVPAPWQGRAVSFRSWWRPWPWWRPFVVDYKADARAETKVIPERGPVTGATAGRLSLPETEKTT